MQPIHEENICKPTQADPNTCPLLSEGFSLATCICDAWVVPHGKPEEGGAHLGAEVVCMVQVCLRCLCVRACSKRCLRPSQHRSPVDPPEFPEHLALGFGDLRHWLGSQPDAPRLWAGSTNTQDQLSDSVANKCSRKIQKLNVVIPFVAPTDFNVIRQSSKHVE